MAAPALGNYIVSVYSQIKEWPLKKAFAAPLRKVFSAPRLEDFRQPPKRIRRNTSRANLRIPNKRRSEKIVECISEYMTWQSVLSVLKYVAVVLLSVIMTIWFQHYFFFLSLPKHADGFAAPGFERVLELFK